jgi:hypothetical protein
MNNSISINVDLISTIQFRSRTPSTYLWREETPEVRGFFNRVKTKTIPAGWYDSSYSEGSYWSKVTLSTNELLSKYISLDYDPDKGEIYNKPVVIVNLGHKQSITERFKTNEEATTWIENLKSLTKITFDVIYY